MNMLRIVILTPTVCVHPFVVPLLETRNLACEQQTHFRSSLLPPPSSYFSEGEKRRPEMRLLFAGYQESKPGNEKRKSEANGSYRVTKHRRNRHIPGLKESRL